eukprot:2009337-Rhodomonas_salina.1
MRATSARIASRRALGRCWGEGDERADRVAMPVNPVPELVDRDARQPSPRACLDAIRALVALMCPHTPLS